MSTVVITMVVEGVSLSQRNTTPEAGNAESFDASRTYLVVPETALQLMPKISQGWKLVPPLGELSCGVPGRPGPAPLTLKLRTVDHGPVTMSLLTAWTRQ